MNANDLLTLKKQITEAKTQMSELTGQRKALLAQLKTDWGCSTIEQAQKKLQQLTEEIDKIDLEIEEGVQELNEKYEIE